jgi:hypothetical protein
LFGDNGAACGLWGKGVAYPQRANTPYSAPT